jgi:hypothetical protein
MSGRGRNNHMKNTNLADPTPMLTKVNVALTIVTFVIAVLYFWEPVAGMQQWLDAPAAATAWAYLCLTPLLGVIARVAYPKARRRVTYGTLVVWFLFVVLVAVTSTLGAGHR